MDRKRSPGFSKNRVKVNGIPNDLTEIFDRVAEMFLRVKKALNIFSACAVVGPLITKGEYVLEKFGSACPPLVIFSQGFLDPPDIVYSYSLTLLFLLFQGRTCLQFRRIAG